MTTLYERTGFDSDPIDRTIEDPEAAFVLGDEDSDVRLAESAPSSRISIDEAALLDEPRHRFAAFVMMVRNGVRGTFARSPKRPKREQKKHYPARFSLEFETSLVDRERRRL